MRASRPRVHDERMTDYLKADQLDDLARAVITLAKELWVMRDRQRALEAILEARDIPVAQALARHVPTPEQQRALDAERQAFVRNLVETLVPPPDTR